MRAPEFLWPPGTAEALPLRVLVRWPTAVRGRAFFFLQRQSISFVSAEVQTRCPRGMTQTKGMSERGLPFLGGGRFLHRPPTGWELLPKPSWGLKEGQKPFKLVLCLNLKCPPRPISVETLGPTLLGYFGKQRILWEAEPKGKKQDTWGGFFRVCYPWLLPVLSAFCQSHVPSHCCHVLSHPRPRNTAPSHHGANHAEL